ncbi:MAG TPA: hypothetical protein P5268_02715 [Candidatus Marinimicrobia bacterium]|nr:hypothetical protein [Candidatus Neomarinimicrobiota bacterium]HRS51940.1 hypothetical protein [Candidatus Neomarinimicrobiota bacterium]HRU91931.1 hypothetical protein [Candidatus Neomarinimicrobiota bacterium]
MIDIEKSDKIMSSKTDKVNFIKNLSRHEKEMGIQISEMEKYKWFCSQDQGYDVGKTAYFEWTQKYSRKVREWLESLSDEEIDRLFAGISDQVKNYIEEKSH